MINNENGEDKQKISENKADGCIQKLTEDTTDYHNKFN